MNREKQRYGETPPTTLTLTTSQRDDADGKYIFRDSPLTITITFTLTITITLTTTTPKII